MRNFKIPVIPETTTKSIRFPNDVLEEIEKLIKGKQTNFTAFVVEACRIAIDDLKDREKESINEKDV